MKLITTENYSNILMILMYINTQIDGWVDFKPSFYELLQHFKDSEYILPSQLK